MVVSLSWIQGCKFYFYLLPVGPSQLPMATHIHRHAATLFDPLHLTVFERRLQVWTVQLNGELCDAMWPAERTRLEGLLGLSVGLILS